MATPLTTSVAHTSKDIREYLITLITMNGYYSVDEQSYIHVASTGEKVPYPFKPVADGTVPRYFSVYDVSQQNSDVYPFNPYVEGLTVSATQQWFFSMMTMNVGTMLRNIMMTILKECLDVKNNKTKQTAEDPNTAVLISPFLTDPIDAKCVTELEYITTKIFDFFNIYYSRKQNHATVTIGVFEPGYKKKFSASRLRERSIELFRKMIRHILNIEDDPRKELAIGPVQRGCAHFDAYMRLFCKLLRRMEKFLYMQKIKVDLDYLEAMSDRCGEFWCTAKNFIVNTAPATPDITNTNSTLNHSVSAAASVEYPFDSSQAASLSPLTAPQRTIECAVPPSRKVEAAPFGQPATPAPTAHQQPGMVAPENISPMLQQPGYAPTAVAPVPSMYPQYATAPVPQQYPVAYQQPYQQPYPTQYQQPAPYGVQPAVPGYSVAAYPFQAPQAVAPTPGYINSGQTYGQPQMAPGQVPYYGAPMVAPQPPTEVFIPSTGGVPVSTPVDINRIAMTNPLLG